MTTQSHDKAARATCFVNDAIARSLLTLPFADLDPNDPFGKVYGYYKHLSRLLEASASGEAPSANALAPIVEMIAQDVAIHEAVGNFLKAGVERQWCAGLQLYFAEQV